MYVVKNIYLLALPLSLITTGSFGVSYDSPHPFVGNFNIEAPLGSKLTVEHPDGFGAMKLAAGEWLDVDAFSLKTIRYHRYHGGRQTLDYTRRLVLNGSPSASTFQTGVLDKNFAFNTSVVNPGSFKTTLNVYELNHWVEWVDGWKPADRFSWNPSPKTLSFQAALLKTSFPSDGGLDGSNAVLTFDAANSRSKGPLELNSKADNKVNIRLVKRGGGAADELVLFFQMLCAKHPTESDGTKGTSAVCTGSEFGPYDSNAGSGSGVDKYKMKLIGAKGNYYHNTIAFVPYSLAPSINAYRGPAPTTGSYNGNLTVTFGVE